ncbi:hypothetical protein FQN51_003226 [Onygenales sp. PD_10]|nr:hypothetical protein FQN51_003226 [Onygenales sp. PD_10]
MSDPPSPSPSPSPTLPAPADLAGVSYLYGHPLLNSLSPLLHKTIYNALGLNWAQIPLSVSDTSNPDVFPPPYTLSPPIGEFLAAAKANPRFVGASVTMPWKVAILPHLDELAEEARGVGACNTIFIREEEEEAGENKAVVNGDCDNGTSIKTNKRRRIFIGTNTDCIGIREALLQNAPPPPPQSQTPTTTSPTPTPYHNKPALIIGGGGTARAAIYALRNWLGASKIYIVNRDRAEVEALMAEDATRYYSSPSSTDDQDDDSHAKLFHITHASQVPALEAPYCIVSGIPNYPPRTDEEVSARGVVEAFLNGSTSTDRDRDTDRVTQGENPSPRGVILEMCYHPRPWTEIAELAAGKGWKVVLGTEAMIWQGIEQARLWTGRDVVGVPGVVEAVKGAVERALEERGGKGGK